MDSVINGIFKISPDPEATDGLIDVSKSISLLCESANNTLAKIGFNIHCTTKTEAGKTNQARLIHFGTFTSFFAHFMHFCMLCSGSGGITINISDTDDHIKLRSSFTCMYPPFYVSNCDSYEKLAELSPKTVIDIAITEAIASSCGYTLSFSVNEDSIDNATVEFSIPITLSPYCFSFDDPFNDILRQRDTDMYLFNLFRSFH